MVHVVFRALVVASLVSCVEEVTLGPVPSDQTDCSFQACGDSCGLYLGESFVSEVDGLPLVCSFDGSCVPFAGGGCPNYDTCTEDDLVCGSACNLCVDGPCESEGEWFCAPLGYCRYGPPVVCD